MGYPMGDGLWRTLLYLLLKIGLWDGLEALLRATLLAKHL